MSSLCRIFGRRTLNMNELAPSSAPLLPPRADDPTTKREGEDIESHEVVAAVQIRQRRSSSKVVEEVKQLVMIALPMMITSFLVYGKMAISMHFLGEMGKDALAGGCLAIGVANITGYSLISGLSAGMDAISSQAFGANQWKLMSLTLERTITILLISCIPITLLWLNLEPFLIICGQNPTISSVAATYLAFSIPDLFFQAFIHPIKIFLRTQKITNPLVLSSFLSLLLHAPINYLIVLNYPTLGIRAIALACAFSNLTFLIPLLLYIKFSGSCSQSWTGLSFECSVFKQWNPILRQAIPCCASVCLEWWCYEIIIVLSGLLQNAPEAVASSAIIIQCTALMYNFPYALSMAVSTRVGNELGANRPKHAKISSFVALCCALFTGLMAMVITISMRTTWGLMFTHDKDILSLLASVLPVVGLCEIGNCPQTTMCGVLRGCARPAQGVNINLISFYFVGLSVSVLMGFYYDLGLMGLWLGMLAAQLVCALTMGIVLANMKWEAMAERARELVGNAEENINNEAIQGLISA